MKKALLFFMVCLVSIINGIIFGTALELVSQPSDFKVLVGVASLIFQATFIYYIIIKFRKK